MSALFHESLPDEAIDKVFAVMSLAPQHTFQVLTKRPERMWDYFARLGERDRVLNGKGAWHAATAQGLGEAVADEEWVDGLCEPLDGPLPNVWLGVSVEDQARADERIPLLLQTPAAVRFLSVEPMIGAVDLRLDTAQRVQRFNATTGAIRGGNEHPDRRECQHGPDAHPDTPHQHYDRPPFSCARCGHRNCEGYRPAVAIHWVIVGGESGPDARPCDVAWIRSVVQQCKAAGTACFVKQLGARPILGGAVKTIGGFIDFAYTVRDLKGGDPQEWPPDLRVREFPAARDRESLRAP